MKTSLAKPSLPPAHDPSETGGERIRRIQEDVRRLARSNGWSNAEVCRRADVATSTYSEFMGGTYRGSYVIIADKLDRWLTSEDAHAETAAAVIQDVSYVTTPTSNEVWDALTFAQTMPTMTVITLGAGMGKTRTLREFAAKRTHAYRVPIEPVDSKPNFTLRKICNALSINPPKRISDMPSVLGERLKRDGRQPLLMLDEAQNLSDESVNQLRFLLDEYGCGIALVGNEDLTVRYALGASREGYGQIHRRIGFRVKRLKPQPEDIEAMLDAWSVQDPEIRRLCRQIGNRAGALGQIFEALRLASIMAYGRSRSMTPDDLTRAWANRSNEELR